jgi:hypothetical protein
MAELVRRTGEWRETTKWRVADFNTGINSAAICFKFA